MTLSTDQKGKIARWLGYTAESDDMNEIDARVTTLEAFTTVSSDISNLVCQLEAIEERIWSQAVVIPHVKLYFISIIEGWRLVQQISRVLALPVRSGAELIWQTNLLSPLVAVASPAETPIVSLPARNLEYCEVVTCPSEADTPPRYPAVGQLWREKSQNATWRWDGLWWRGVSAGVNHWHENIAIEKTITLASATLTVRQKGSPFPKVGADIPVGYCIEQVRTAIAYDNVRSNSKIGSGVTGTIGVGIVKVDETAGRSGRKLQANTDTFQKPGAQSPPTGVSTGLTEVWTDQIPPDVNNPDNNRTLGPSNTAQPGAYLINGLQAIGTQVLAVDTGAVAPAAGTVFTIGTDQTLYTVLGGATLTSWPITPGLVVAAADNAVVAIRGAGISVVNNTRTTVSSAAAGAAGTITNAGGKTATINRNTREQASLATSDFSHVTTANDIYEYFYPLTGFDNFGVEILAVGKDGETCLVAGRVNFSVSAIRAGA